jgi:IstB-like ATP binding protein
MAKAFADQIQRPEMASLTFEEHFGLIVDYQMTDLENRRMHNRLKSAKLRLSASIDDLDFRKEGALIVRRLCLFLLQGYIEVAAPRE